MAHSFVSKLSSGLIVLLAPVAAHAATTYYVSPTGSDTAAGTLEAPFASWARAQTAVSAGDTVYFRGGTYKYTTATSTCGGDATATVNSIILSKSGTSASPINYFAYQDEKPVFDFSGVTDMSKYNCRHVGVSAEADWLHVKGLGFTGVLQLNNLNHESWGVYVFGGSNNTFEQLDANHNMGPGFFIRQGGHNTFLNCDSHENEDPLTANGDGQSADGFGCHPNHTGDTGNLFHGCRGWWNSDDNWDFINASAACTVEYSWAWYAGYKPDKLNNGAPVSLAAGNGNGIKAGGYGKPATGVPNPVPQHIVRFNISFYNKVNGFYANHELVSPFFYNNTSFNNGADYNMLGLSDATDTPTDISVGTLRNNVAYSSNGRALTADMDHGGPITDMFDSWDTNLNLKVSDADFQSVAFEPAESCPPTDMTCFAGMASARQADGSLPVLPFLRLAATSPLIDKGTNVGLPFVGKAPDLGGFEYGAVSVPIGIGGTAAAGGSTSAGTGGMDAGGSGPISSAGSDTTLGGDSNVGTAGGSPAAGGDTSLPAGGGAATGGAPTSSSAASAVAGGPGSMSPGSTDSSSGCSCRLSSAASTRTGAGSALGLLLGLGAWLRRRKARRSLGA